MSDGFELQDALESLQDVSSYEIPNEHDIHDTEPGPLLQRAFHVRRAKVTSDHHTVSQMPSTKPHTTWKPLQTRRYSTSFVAYSNTQMQSLARS